MKKLFRTFTLILALWLAFFNPVNVSLVYAQEDTSSPSTTDTSSPLPTGSNQPIDQSTAQPTPTPDATLTTGDTGSSADSNTSSNTSDISVTPSPSPTDSPTDTPADSNQPIDQSTIQPTSTPDPNATDSGVVNDIPTPTPTPSDISVDQTGTTNSDTTSSADSGNNVQENASGSAETTTGSAVASANSITVTNLSEVNSNLITVVQNILTSNAPDVDLYTALENAIAANPNFVPTNTDITVNQGADTSTNTQGSANSGDNTQSSAANAMTTGDAVSLANALNAVNLNLVGSNVVLTIINILADWNGNIILPDGSQLSVQSLISGGTNVNVNQAANVSTNTESSAGSGGNTQTGGGDGGVTTGNSVSAANSQSLVNIVEIGNGLGYLVINNLGNWSGSLINWSAPGSSESFAPGSYNLLSEYGTSGTGTGGTTNITSNQFANVNTNVNSSATTGNNSQTGGSSSLTTGNATSLANNFTLANLTSVRGGIFFGIINILGNWTGNIYSGPKPPDPAPAVSDNSDSGSPDTRTPDLGVSVSNNVNGFVYPGDTIWVTIEVNNNSVFTAKNVELKATITDDHPVAGSPIDVNLGDIVAGGKKTITFNATLPKDSISAIYHINAQAIGHAESGDSSSASGESDFLVKFIQNFTGVLVPTVEAAAAPQASAQIPEVLGESTMNWRVALQKYWPAVFVLLAVLYASVVVFRKRVAD